MKKFLMFDEINRFKKWNNRQTKYDLLLLSLVMVIVPTISWIVCTSGINRSIYNSMSSLAWVDKKLFAVIIWGLFNVSLYLYLIILCIKDSGMEKIHAWLFISFAILAFVLLFSAALTPCTYGDTERERILRNLHNRFSHFGFGIVAVETILFPIFLLFRNKRQFVLAVFGFCFVFFLLMFSMTQANIPESPSQISSFSQVIIFTVINCYFMILYFTDRVFQIESKPN